MKGDTDIKEQAKGPFLRRTKGNIVIKRINRKWKVTGIDELLGKVEVLGGDKDVTLSFELNTVDVFACDDGEGEPKLFRLIGYAVPEEE